MHKEQTGNANTQRVETQDINVENPNVGKTTAAHRLQEYNVEETQRQRPLVLLFTTRGGGYKMEATTSLSLSLSLSLLHALLHALYN